MNAKKPRVVILAGPGMTSMVIYQALRSEFEIIRVYLENKIPPKKLILARVKRLGLFKVFGQLLFISFNKLIARMSKSRIRELIHHYKLNDGDFEIDILTKVNSINCDEVKRGLKELKPDAVVVNGTRIISEEVLSSIDAPFINIHMGITPKYRGVHGGYWALAQQDNQNCGVTVHLVDKGIDTGGILYQDVISPQGSDNFNTYPVHQIAKAIPLIKAALNDVAAGTIKLQSGAYPSQLWYHPTLYEYARSWIINGVK